MDFAANADLINELKSKLNEAIEKIEECKTAIYGGIDDLETSWSGESYTVFHDKCYSYQEAIDSLVLVLKAYDKMLTTVESDTTQLVSDVARELNI